MIFIHTSDIHLGAIPDSDKHWGKDRSYDIKDTFQNLIKKCNDINADLLLIAGDLFHHQPLTSDLNEINELFKTIPKTHIVIIAGSNDRIRNNSSVLSFNFNENVHYILPNTLTEINIPTLNLIVHGFSYHKSEITAPIIDQIKIFDDNKSHILLCYGGDTNHCPIDFDLLASKNFAYCALGHNHKHQEIVDKKIAYSGSLEPIDIRDTKEHGIYIGEINEKENILEKFYFEPMSKICYIPLGITISEDTTNDELISSITNEIYSLGIKNIYTLNIKGCRNPDIDFDFSKLNKKLRIVNIIDESEAKYNFIELEKNHPNDMIGAYIRSFYNGNLEELSYIQKKALFYGVNALIKNTNDKD